MIRKFNEVFELYCMIPTTDERGEPQLEPKFLERFHCLILPQNAADGTHIDDELKSRTLTEISSRQKLPHGWFNERVEMHRNDQRFRILSYRDLKKTCQMTLELIQDVEVDSSDRFT